MAQKVMCPVHPDTQMLCPTCDEDDLPGLQGSDRILAFSDVKRDKLGRMSFTHISSADYAGVKMEVYRAYEQQQVALSEVEGHVRSGKISPAARDQFTRIALSDIESFRGIVETMKPMVDLKEYGHGGAGGTFQGTEDARVENEVISASEARAKADGIPFSEAMKREEAERPTLFKRFRSSLQLTMRADG